MQRSEAHRVSASLLLSCLVLLFSRVVGNLARAEQTSAINGAETVVTQQQPVSTHQERAPKSLYSNDEAVDLAVELHRSLRFDPPHVDFGSWSVGTAHSQLVTLVNQNANRSVYLSSVSGRTPAFYSSFFEAKVVPPQGNTTFSVVFLPREHGTIATDLLIHTSFGQARLVVRGEGRECPYRLKPIVGIKAPLNATLTPEIHMFNPHGRPLQILEVNVIINRVYSSGGQFQLELPSGAQEGPQTLWEIPAYTTKPVIRIRFHGNTAGNYTAYIRIKISERLEHTENASEQVLVVPVEFEILPQHGLYAEQPLLDFGRLTTYQKSPVKLKLELRNSHAQSSYELSTEQSVSGIPGLRFDATEASFTLEPHLMRSTVELNELLTLRAVAQKNDSSAETQPSPPSQPQEFTVLVRARVFKGNLAYNRNTSLFITQEPQYTSGELRRLVIRNEFELPLTLLNVSVQQNATQVLYMHLSSTYTGPGMVLAAGAALELLHLRVLNDSERFKTTLLIHTNITNFEVPIVVCSGRLHVSTQHAGQQLQVDSAYNVELNLGAIPLAEMSHDGYIVLQNRNPLPIKLSTWDFQSGKGIYFHTTFLGCIRNVSTAMAVKIESIKYTLCSQLFENDMAVFQVAIQSYITEPHSGTLKIWTVYELINTTVKFRTWAGKLEVDQEQLYFKNCFPGQLCTADLSIRSSFKHDIHVTAISFADAGLRFMDFNASGSVLAPDAVTKVGRIFFEPATRCQQRCYIPLDGKSNAMAFPLPHETKGGSNNNMHFDELELRRRTELFRSMKYIQATSLTLSSEEVRQFQLQLIIDIEWPKLVVGGKQTLPTVEVGKVQQMPITITNPSNRPILIDYFLADPGYAEQTQLSLPHEVVDISTSCYLTNQAVFSLPDGALKQPLLLPARSSHSLLVQFISAQPDTHCTLLHIRNNLTLYEAVWVRAKAVQSQFRFGNRNPGATTPLLFDINERHLSACTSSERQSSSERQPLISTKRAFTARNKGEIPIRVDGFWIGDRACEGYGFKVLDCGSFELRANQSKRIEIAFSPDFTSSIVSRPLTLITNLSYPVTYKLLATLPAGSMAACAEFLPRPDWELRIRNAVIVLLAVTFVLVLIAAHVDYGNILVSQSQLYTLRDRAAVHHFNLRNIAAKTRTNNANSPTATEEETSTVTTSATTVASNSKNSSSSTSSATQHCRANCQQLKNANCNSSSNSSSGSGNNNGNCKKRNVRKLSNWSINSRDGVAGAETSWPVEATATTVTTNTLSMKNVPTFSERNFKMKLEAAAAAVAASAAAAITTANASETETAMATVTADKTSKPSVNSNNIKNAKSPTNIVKDNGKKQQQVQQQQQQSIQQRSQRKNKNNLPLQTVNNSADDVEREDTNTRRKEAANAKVVATTTTPVIAERNSPGLNGYSASSSSASSTVTEKSTPTTAATAIVKSAVGVWKKVVETTTVPLAAETKPNTQQSHTNNTTKEHKDANSAPPRRYGKTPGKERRKEAQHNYGGAGGGAGMSAGGDGGNSMSSSTSSSSSNGTLKRSERNHKQRNKAVSALNFNEVTSSLLGAGVNCISSPWETSSQVSFSDVLQQSTNNVLDHGNTYKDAQQAETIAIAHALLSVVNNGNGDGNETLTQTTNNGSITTTTGTNAFEAVSSIQNKESTINSNNNNNDNSNNNGNNTGITELGPIGTRKSPSSTPVWIDSTVNVTTTPISSTMPLIKPIISNNSSFFSNVGDIPPHAASTAATAYGNNNATGNNGNGNGTVGSSVGGGYDDVQSFMNVSTNMYGLEYLLSLRQQQLQTQQQQQQQQLLQNVTLDPSHNWAAGAWYGGSQITDNGANSWQAAAAGMGLMRPPPGLEASFQHQSQPQPQPHHHQQHHQHPLNLHHQQMQRAPHQHHHQQQQHHQHQQQQQQPQHQLPLSNHHDALAMAQTQGIAVADMQTFDPFSSLSSIWSENWNKHNNHNTNNNNNNNNNNGNNNPHNMN